MHTPSDAPAALPVLSARSGLPVLPPLPAQPGGVRDLVHASWVRSSASRLDPDAVPEPTLLDDSLRAVRDEHPLTRVLGTIQTLLVRHTTDTGLMVAVGDQAGRLLWVDGDHDVRRRAESMGFVAGTDWSETAVGTNAPGTALVLDRAVQIRRTEHFARIVHPWSCTAVPVHDRATGSLLGVIDITGGDDAVAPTTLALVEATALAVEAELHLLTLEDRLARRAARRPSGFTLRRLAAPTAAKAAPAAESAQPTGQAGTTRGHAPLLRVLGRDDALLEVDGDRLVLSGRHAEILTLLAWHPRGLGAEELATAVYGRDDALVTLRAEMVRLRRALEPASLQVLSRPYRVGTPLDLDASQVLAFLDRGAHRVAFAGYVGPVLPGSASPGVAAARSEVSRRLRESLLADAGVDTLLAFARTAEGADDVELWTACLRLLPGRSPRRAAVVAHLEDLEVRLGRATP